MAVSLEVPSVGPADAWEDDQISALVHAAVGQNRHLFDRFRDLSDEDLCGDVMIAVVKARARFNPTVATLSTFVNLIVRRRLIDIWRQRSREATRQIGYTKRVWGVSVMHGAAGIGLRSPNGHHRTEPVDDTTPLDALTADEPDPEKPLADWLCSVYVAAKRMIEFRRIRRGPRFVPAEQAVAVGLLMVRLHLAADQCREMFERRPDLCRAVHFARPGQSDHLVRVPSIRWFSDAWVLCIELLERPGVRPALMRLAPVT